MTETQNKRTKLVMVLLGVGFLARLLYTTRIVLSFYPSFMGDFTYLDDARRILSLDFHELGDRTPVYPLFLVLCGLNGWAVYVVQSLMGLAVSYMIFDMALRRTRHGPLSVFIGLVCSLLLNVLVYEPEIVTETLATFLVVTSVWLIARGESSAGNNFGYPLGAGLIAALAGLTRPLLLCLVPVYYCFVAPVWPYVNMFKRDCIKKTLLFAMPVTVLVLGWCEFNYLNNGFFSPTTRAGQQLMDQVAPYVELAPDRFAVLSDIWLKYRVHDQSEDYNATWYSEEAETEMEMRTGKSRVQVMHDLTDLALYLEIHHPVLCIRRAEQGWIHFWGGAGGDEINWPRDGEVGLTRLARPVAKFLIREVMAVFLILALLSLPCALFHRMVFTRIEYLIFAIALWTSIFAAFTEYGDNFRFSVPFLPLIFYTVLTWGWTCITTVASGSCTRSLPPDLRRL